MKYTLNLKYDIGDEVRYVGKDYHHCYGRSWSGSIPDEENHWMVDGYSIEINESGINVRYCFHAYCNKWFEYHDLINESDLEPVSSSNPQTIEFEPKDAFGNPIELGQMIYYGLYHYNPPYDEDVKHSNFMAFEKRGTVKEFVKSRNMTFIPSDCVRFEVIDDKYGCPDRDCAHISGVITKIPETFVDDMLEIAKNSHLEDSYYMERFKKITGWFGLSDECVKVYEDWKNGRLKDKERRRKKKKETKTFDAKSMLKGLSEKEKQALLKELMK